MTTFNKKAFKGLPTGIKVRKPRYYYQDIVEVFDENSTKDLTLTEFEGLDYDFAGGLISFKGKELWNRIAAPDFEGFLVPYGLGEEYITTKKGLKYNVVGSPVVVDGVASGFSGSSYIQIPNAFKPANESWEFVFKVTTPSSWTQQRFFGSVGNYYKTIGGEFKAEGNFGVGITSNGSSWDVCWMWTTSILQVNTTYWIKVSFTGTQYKLELSTDGVEYTLENSKDSTALLYQKDDSIINIGYMGTETAKYFQGSVDLNESYIKIGSKYVWGKNAESFITVKGCLAENVKIYPTVGATLSAFVKGNEILLDNKDIDKEGYTWAGQYSIPSFSYKPLYKQDFNMVGNVIMNSDVSYSGFSANNYISFNGGFNVGSNTWEVVAKFTTTSSFPNLQGIYHFHNAYSSNGRYGLIIRTQGNKFNFTLSSGYSWMLNATGSYTLQPNTTYWVKASFDGSKYVLSYSLDGKTYIDDIVYNSTDTLLSGLNIMVAGVWYDGSSYIEPLLGKLYIADCYIKISDKVYRPMEVIDPNPSYFP